MEFHVVAQIIEAEFVVGRVGDVGRIGVVALFVGQSVHDAAHLQAEKFVNLAHPAGVALGQIVVDGDDVDTLAFERVEIDRQCGHQGFAFAGLHFGDHAIVQHHAAQQLNIEVALPEGALGRFADRGKGFDQQAVHRRALGKLLAKGVGARPQVCVA